MRELKTIDGRGDGQYRERRRWGGWKEGQKTGIVYALWAITPQNVFALDNCYGCKNIHDEARHCSAQEMTPVFANGYPPLNVTPSPLEIFSATFHSRLKTELYYSDSTPAP